MLNHRILFDILREHGLPECYVRLMSFAYGNQVAHVQWGACFSDRFSISDGVRQGGIFVAAFVLLLSIVSLIH